MQVATISRVLGLLLMILSLTLIPPIMVEQWFNDGYIQTFHLSFAITMGLGFLLWYPVRAHKHPLRTHDGFFIVVLFWFAAALFGALPFYWMVEPHVTFTDAFFEAMSGVTTTGSTIFPDLDRLPYSILYYRQQLQFLGGISIILLAVAILPTLGVGGMQLFRTEITGPVKDDKLTPRITQTAKAIWLIYVTMSVLCALSYRLTGMNWFDAIGHSFSTVSTGGFSTHDAGLDQFANPYIKVIAIFFMLLSAINFNLHFLVFKRKNLSIYWQDPELRFYLKLCFYSMLLMWVGLVLYNFSRHTPLSLINSVFQLISISTTTGFTTTGLTFPAFVPLMLLFLGMIGGCAGSTSGGLKIVRVLLLQKQATREIRRLIHPHGQYLVKLGNKPISGRVIESIWGFFAVYFVVFLGLLLLLVAVEKDFFSLYSALIATFSNTGPGLGMVSENYAALNDPAKWILSFAMLAGRLEIFTILVLFSPTFWRR